MAADLLHNRWQLTSCTLCALINCRQASRPISTAPPANAHVPRNVLLHLLPAQGAVGPQVEVSDARLQVVREVLREGHQPSKLVVWLLTHML